MAQWYVFVPQFVGRPSGDGSLTRWHEVANLNEARLWVGQHLAPLWLSAPVNKSDLYAIVCTQELNATKHRRAGQEIDRFTRQSFARGLMSVKEQATLIQISEPYPPAAPDQSGGDAETDTDDQTKGAEAGQAFGAYLGDGVATVGLKIDAGKLNVAVRLLEEVAPALLASALPATGATPPPPTFAFVPPKPNGLQRNLWRYRITETDSGGTPIPRGLSYDAYAEDTFSITLPEPYDTANRYFSVSVTEECGDSELIYADYVMPARGVRQPPAPIVEAALCARQPGARPSLRWGADGKPHATSPNVGTAPLWRVELPGDAGEYDADYLAEYVQIRKFRSDGTFYESFVLGQNNGNFPFTLADSYPFITRYAYPFPGQPPGELAPVQISPYFAHFTRDYDLAPDTYPLQAHFVPFPAREPWESGGGSIAPVETTFRYDCIHDPLTGECVPGTEGTGELLERIEKYVATTHDGYGAGWIELNYRGWGNRDGTQYYAANGDYTEAWSVIAWHYTKAPPGYMLGIGTPTETRIYPREGCTVQQPPPPPKPCTGGVQFDPATQTVSFTICDDYGDSRTWFLRNNPNDQSPGSAGYTDESGYTYTIGSDDPR